MSNQINNSVRQESLIYSNQRIQQSEQNHYFIFELCSLELNAMHREPVRGNTLVWDTVCPQNMLTLQMTLLEMNIVNK
jgi:hypothetical protein